MKRKKIKILPISELSSSARIKPHVCDLPTQPMASLVVCPASRPLLVSHYPCWLPSSSSNKPSSAHLSPCYFLYLDCSSPSSGLISHFLWVSLKSYPLLKTALLCPSSLSVPLLCFIFLLSTSHYLILCIYLLILKLSLPT